MVNYLNNKILIRIVIVKHYDAVTAPILLVTGVLVDQIVPFVYPFICHPCRRIVDNRQVKRRVVLTRTVRLDENACDEGIVINRPRCKCRENVKMPLLLLVIRRYKRNPRGAFRCTVVGQCYKAHSFFFLPIATAKVQWWVEGLSGWYFTTGTMKTDVFIVCFTVK